MSSSLRPTWNWPLFLAIALAGAGGGLAGPGCLEQRREMDSGADGRCATCHGDPDRPGDFLRRAAPPLDLVQASDPRYPGIGAHALHLDPSATHGPIECTECHRVPSNVHDPEHIDDPRPAELVFGLLARSGSREPAYDPKTRTCADTWCHRNSDAVWTRPREPAVACGSCHSLPPPAPHPASEKCSACHGDVIDATRRIVRPELHVNGKVDLAYPPESCGQCHGSGADPAPPPDTQGLSVATSPRVGAHRAHRVGGASGRPVECTECHVVPSVVDTPGHVDDDGRAEVLLSGTSSSRGHTGATYDQATATCVETWCHGPERPAASPRWTDPTALSCTSCHGAPPAAPHPQSDRCSVCHGAVVDADRKIVDRSLHVDGVVSVAYPADACVLCHGSGNDPAPPPDALGQTDRSTRGVGAHQAHLHASTARPLACGECHLVPADEDVAAHVNGLPAEVTLLGVATAGGNADARYDGATGRCVDTWCHGGKGGSTSPSPRWDEPGPLPCNGCHGAPPPAPHPQMNDCSLCHSNVAANDTSFVDPSRHGDGHVDVTPPADCITCHGGLDGPAPPFDTGGGASPSRPGVGAHAAHVRGTPRARAVPCTTCHAVPTNLLDAGHLDSTLPAEVSLTGVAAAWGGTPTYRAGACSDTSCHGAKFPSGHASGGTRTEPTWTEGGAGAPCGSCHGLPPPRPHPYGNLNPVCSKCHENIADDNRTFVRPDLHVDGQVTFTVP